MMLDALGVHNEIDDTTFGVLALTSAKKTEMAVVPIWNSQVPDYKEDLEETKVLLEIEALR